MESFLQKHASSVIGSLSGFDRLIFRGTLLRLAYASGMMAYLSAVSVLLKDFGKHVQKVTEQIKAAVRASTEKQGRPMIYLRSSRVDKEKVARDVAAQDKIREGLICTLSTIEPCNSYEIYRNAETKHIELRPRLRKCLHLYQYSIDPTWGFMHARIQTWFPLSIQVYINGREWLSRQMDRAGIGYQRRENCFVWLQDPHQTQRLMDDQLRTDWPNALNTIAKALNPVHRELFKLFPIDYYWSTYQSEWATD